MSIYKDIKKAVSSTVNMVVDKTSTQAQKSRLAAVMRTEAKNIDLLYIKLGQYAYANLRDTLPENMAENCDRIDESKERMSRAQAKYREVIQQELVNKEIGRAEAKENFVKIKEPIVAKAKDTAVLVKEKAVDTAGKVRTDAAVKVEELKRAAAERKLNHKQAGETIVTDDSDKTEYKELDDTMLNIYPDKEVNEAINEAIGESEENADTARTAAEDAPVSETESVEEQPEAAFAGTETSSEAAEDSEDHTPDNKPLDQEFQRSVPVDIISETEFEENEPEIKPLERTNPIAKAMKLRKIISKKESTDE